MRKPMAQRIAELEEQKKSLMARLNRQERARDTRRKILMGSFILDHLAHSDDTDFMRHLNAWLRQNLPDFLTRDNDKDLFNDILRWNAPPASPLPDGFDTGRQE